MKLVVSIMSLVVFLLIWLVFTFMVKPGERLTIKQMFLGSKLCPPVWSDEEIWLATVLNSIGIIVSVIGCKVYTLVKQR